MCTALKARHTWPQIYKNFRQFSESQYFSSAFRNFHPVGGERQRGGKPSIKHKILGGVVIMSNFVD